jgi:hypothetical protein
MTGDEPIEAYLDELLLELHGSPRAARYALREVEEHLRDATRDGVAQGLDETMAAHRAVERFGSPTLVARELGDADEAPGAVALVRDAVASLVPVGAVFLLAIGLSGLVAEGLGLAFGTAFVAGDPPGVTYTPARCADFLALEPDAGSCREAAIAHHFGEVVDYRLAAGALGALVLTGWTLWRTRARGRLRRGALGRSFPLTVGAALATAAAAGLLFLGLPGVVTGASDGSGNPLSGAVVSAVLALVFCVALLRELRARRVVGT